MPKAEGDILLYFSSDHADLNREMASQVRELFGKDGELIEEFFAEGFAQTNASGKIAQKIF